MPARFGFAAAKAGECGFLFLRGPFRRITRIKTDEDHFVVAAGVEGKHAQRANHTLLHLIAEHGAWSRATGPPRQEWFAPVRRAAEPAVRRLRKSQRISSSLYFLFSAGGAVAVGKPFSAMIFIASLTGIWAIPAFLSIHSSFSLAAMSACNFSRKSFCGSLGCPGTPCSRGSGGMRA